MFDWFILVFEFSFSSQILAFFSIFILDITFYGDYIVGLNSFEYAGHANIFFYPVISPEISIRY